MRIGNETDGFTETGQYITGGLVQICLDGVYHTICDVGFDEMAAEIACRSQFGDSYCKLLEFTSVALLLRRDDVLPSTL